MAAKQPAALTPEELLQIWAADAQRSLGWFGEFVFRADAGRPLRPARHHDVWVAGLEAMEAGEINRLLIIAPPGHAKSEWCSKVFPAWYLGRHPDHHLIGASNTATLAELFSVAVRDTIEQAGDYHLVFPEAKPDKVKGWGEAEWFLQRDNRSDKDASYSAAGVGGPIIGRRGNGLLVDDPYNEEIANSPALQRQVKMWIQRTALSRLRRHGWACVVMTRWVPEDLAQDLINKGWTVIHMPALSEDGAHARISGKPPHVEALRRRLEAAGFDRFEPMTKVPGPAGSVGVVVRIHEDQALWPEEQPKADLEAKRDESGQAIFDAMWQGDTSTMQTGKMFQRQWFRIVDDVPVDGTIWVRRWDLAATEVKAGKDPDWTAGPKLGFNAGRWYLADMRRTRATPGDVEELVKQTAVLDSFLVPIRMEQEPGSAGVNTIDHYRRAVLPGYDFQGVRSTGPKDARLRPLSAAAQAGNFYLVRGPWNETFLHEAENHGNPGVHDDQLDAAAGAMQDLMAVGEPQDDYDPDPNYRG